jgi:CubicO group peptidase (beta-lactamase class C family)
VDAGTGGGSGDGGTTDPAGGVAGFDAWLGPQVAPLIDVTGAAGKATAVVVGVSTPALRHVFGHGMTKVGGAAPGGTTLFEIGSVTKVYTGVLLGRSVGAGDLALGDLINPYFPLGAPSRNGTSISLLDLATHSSGLPDFDPGYVSGVPMSPGANYGEEDLAACMAGGCPLAFTPGARAQYSNLGSGTLGHILRKRAQRPTYLALVSQEILAPLQLTDTTVVLSAEQQSRMAQGYANGSPAPPIQIGEPLAGAGALRSTALDVLRFLESSFDASTPALAAAWQLALEPRRPAGPNMMIGLQVAVETTNGKTVCSKGGNTPGFSSYVFITPSQRAAVVVLANSGGLNLKPLGLAVLDRLHAPAP